MSRLTFISALIVLFALNAFGDGLARAQTPWADATPIAENLVLPPDAEVAGSGLGEWSARSWQYFFSLPQAVNPYFDETGEWCGYGQSGPVFMLAGADHDVTRSCVVPAGSYVFVPIIGSECSTVEPEPFFGSDEASLKSVRTAMSTRLTTSSTCQRCRSRSTVRQWTIFPRIVPQAHVSHCGFRRTTSSIRPAGRGCRRRWLPDMVAPLSEGEHTLTFIVPGRKQ